MNGAHASYRRTVCVQTRHVLLNHNVNCSLCIDQWSHSINRRNEFSVSESTRFARLSIFLRYKLPNKFIARSFTLHSFFRSSICWVFSLDASCYAPFSRDLSVSAHAQRKVNTHKRPHVSKKRKIRLAVVTKWKRRWPTEENQIEIKIKSTKLYFSNDYGETIRRLRAIRRQWDLK